MLAGLFNSFFNWILFANSENREEVSTENRIEREY